MSAPPGSWDRPPRPLFGARWPGPVAPPSRAVLAAVVVAGLAMAIAVPEGRAGSASWCRGGGGRGGARRRWSAVGTAVRPCGARGIGGRVGCRGGGGPRVGARRSGGGGRRSRAPAGGAGPRAADSTGRRCVRRRRLDAGRAGAAAVPRCGRRSGWPRCACSPPWRRPRWRWPGGRSGGCRPPCSRPRRRWCGRCPGSVAGCAAGASAGCCGPASPRWSGWPCWPCSARCSPRPTPRSRRSWTTCCPGSTATR